MDLMVSTLDMIGAMPGAGLRAYVLEDRRFFFFNSQLFTGGDPGTTSQHSLM
jgi:hypothetical protein